MLPQGAYDEYFFFAFTNVKIGKQHAMENNNVKTKRPINSLYTMKAQTKIVPPEFRKLRPKTLINPLGSDKVEKSTPLIRSCFCFMTRKYPITQ